MGNGRTCSFLLRAPRVPFFIDQETIVMEYINAAVPHTPDSVWCVVSVWVAGFPDQAHGSTTVCDVMRLYRLSRLITDTFSSRFLAAHVLFQRTIDTVLHAVPLQPNAVDANILIDYAFGTGEIEWRNKWKYCYVVVEWPDVKLPFWFNKWKKYALVGCDVIEVSSSLTLHFPRKQISNLDCFLNFLYFFFFCF